MNGRSQMHGGKNWIFPKEICANRFFWDSHWLEIWKYIYVPLCPSMEPNGWSVASGYGLSFDHPPSEITCSCRTAFERDSIMPCAVKSSFKTSLQISLSRSIIYCRLPYLLGQKPVFTLQIGDHFFLKLNSVFLNRVCRLHTLIITESNSNTISTNSTLRNAPA